MKKVVGKHNSDSLYVLLKCKAKMVATKVIKGNEGYENLFDY